LLHAEAGGLRVAGPLGRLLRRSHQRLGGLAAELLLEEPATRLQLFIGGAPVARERVAPDQQLLEVLVVRIQVNQPPRERGSLRWHPRGEAVECGFAERCGGGSDEPATLEQQPSLERRRSREVHALEELPAQPR
jgi:hypothetical protein